MCMSESESRGKRLSNAHDTQTEEPSAQTPPSDLSLARRFKFLNLLMRASHCSSARTAQPVMPDELCGASVFLRGLDHPGRGTLICSRRGVVSAAIPACSSVAASAPPQGSIAQRAPTIANGCEGMEAAWVRREGAGAAPAPARAGLWA